MFSSRASLYRILRNTTSNHNAPLLHQVCFKSTVATTLPRFSNNEQGGASGREQAGGDQESCLERFQPAIEKRYCSRVIVDNNNNGTAVAATLSPVSPSAPLLQFIDQVPLAVKERSDKAIPPGADNDPLMQLFRQSELTPDDWSRYAFFDSSRAYTRNLIATDYETYTLLLLCWNPQKESLIHDHPGDGCWLKVLLGSIQESRYSDTLELQSEAVFTEGQIGWITDSIGYHKIGNPTMDQPAVTLHIYAPPVQQCRIWRKVTDPESNTSNEDNITRTSDETFVCQKCTSTHYSEYGVPLKKKLE